MKETILVIGACGQIGTELLTALRKQHGDFHVIAADLRPVTPELEAAGPYEQFDVLNRGALSLLIAKHNITHIYLLAAMLSATSEQHPHSAWQLNMQSLLNVLELAKEERLKQIFWPSSIAVFGPGAAMEFCPQDAPLYPTTVYGISKAAGENWCAYYHQKFGVDVRSLRYPGLISHKAKPGGGTTDYAVEIFHHAVAGKPYTCYLRPETRLPMMYMPDAIRATLECMEAPESSITIRTSYNLAAMSFSPEELAAEIRKHYPKFNMQYAPDWRQAIADSWPLRIDDVPARKDWRWEGEYDLPAMTRDMLRHLGAVKKPSKSSNQPRERLI